MMKHKKLLTAAAAAVMLLSFGATTAFASDTWQERWCTDANGDGICDHAAGSCQFVDANGDGVCDRCGLTCRGTGWLDADGDGVCDHYTVGDCYSCGSHHGSGHGYGYGYGSGRHCR